MPLPRFLMATLLVVAVRSKIFHLRKNVPHSMTGLSPVFNLEQCCFAASVMDGNEIVEIVRSYYSGRFVLIENRNLSANPTLLK